MLLKMSALFIFNHNLIHIYLSTQLIKPNCIETPSFSLLKMQHQSFARNLPPLFIGCMCKQLATANPFTTLLLCTVRFETQLSFFFLIFILHIKFWGIREYPHSPSCHQTWCAVCQRNYLWIECKMCGFTSGFQKGTLTTWTDNLSVTDVTGVCIYNVQCVYVTGHAVNSFFSADSICKRYYQIIELIFCLFIFNS